MKACENHISPASKYYAYSPSLTAQEMFFYPLYTGHFIYESGYSLRRDRYDSFLLMYVISGRLTLEFEDTSQQVTAGSFVFIDCYKPHAYSSDTGWEGLWCHFDGPSTRPYYNTIVSHLGCAFSLPDPAPVTDKLAAILQAFQAGGTIREPLLSKYLTDILTVFLLYSPARARSFDCGSMAEEIITYINEHFAEDIPVSRLARMAGLSQYHFIRTFKKETGYTPHEYLVNTRISTARYLLKNSRLSIKDICFHTGFSCESVFCSAFKKHMQVTPAQYRAQSGE